MCNQQTACHKYNKAFFLSTHPRLVLPFRHPGPSIQAGVHIGVAHHPAAMSERLQVLHAAGKQAGRVAGLRSGTSWLAGAEFAGRMARSRRQATCRSGRRGHSESKDRESKDRQSCWCLPAVFQAAMVIHSHKHVCGAPASSKGRFCQPQGVGGQTAGTPCNI